MNISMQDVLVVGPNLLKAKLFVGEHVIETEVTVREERGLLFFGYRNLVFSAIVERAFIIQELCEDLARFIRV